MLHWLIAFDTNLAVTMLLTNLLVPFSLRLSRTISHLLEQILHMLLCPPLAALVRGALTDLTYTKAELITENVLAP